MVVGKYGKIFAKELSGLYRSRLSTCKSFTDVCSKQMFLKYLQNHKKTPVLESLFNKVADLKACNFIKKRLQGKFLRAAFLQNTSGSCFCIISLEFPSPLLKFNCSLYKARPSSCPKNETRKMTGLYVQPLAIFY